jgi:hypothetical protein
MITDHLKRAYEAAQKLPLKDQDTLAMKRLPPLIRKQADRAFEHFALDPRYPSLHF